MPISERRALFAAPAAPAGTVPAPLLAQTLEIAERCTFKLDELRYEYPEEIVPAGATPTSHLRALTSGAAPGVGPAARRAPCAPTSSMNCV